MSQESKRPENAVEHSKLVGRNGDIFLPNREFFFNRAGPIFNEFRRSATFLLAYIDLRHFKEVNDEFGHAAGNDALDEYFRHLSGKFRVDEQAQALIAREGGDEFILLAQHTFTDPEDRLLVINSVHERIRASGINFNGIDISARMAIVESVPEKPAESIEDLFREADQALLRVRKVEKTGSSLHPLQGMLDI
jgi:diguanylate cyclase (GGDEF)-like protein